MFDPESIDTPAFDRINPARCVNARLRRLHRLINSAYQEAIRPFGLRGSMLSILFIIGKKRQVNQKFIAERLVLDASTMSRDIKKLREKGWVVSSPGEDSRETILSLSREGYELLEEVSPVWEALHHRVEAVLGTFHNQQIDVLIEAISSQLSEIKS